MRYLCMTVSWFLRYLVTACCQYRLCSTRLARKPASCKDSLPCKLVPGRVSVLWSLFVVYLSVNGVV